MQKLLFTIAFCLLTGLYAQAQTQTTASGQTAGQSVFAEIFGPGIASINYDTRFTKQNGGIGGRIGIGGFSLDGYSVFTIPVAVNYLVSKDNKNFFEAGLGFTYLHNSDTYYDDDDFFSGTFGHVSVGYRLQPPNGGFQFRGAITPIFGSFGFYPLYASLSFGYRF